MQMFPEDFSKLELGKYEKLFSRQTEKLDSFGYYLIHINPAMQENEKINALITSKGILFVKFFEGVENPAVLSLMLSAYRTTAFEQTCSVIKERLMNNKNFVENNRLKFSVNYILVFPNVEPEGDFSSELRSFVKNNCVFKSEYKTFRDSWEYMIPQKLEYSFCPVSVNPISISEDNIAAVVQRIAPEYTIVRFGNGERKSRTEGIDQSKLVIDENDIAVKAYTLDETQINIVNKIQLGDQLILACAGSGKSVLLIAKCFKAARMNPDKKFLITCYNKNLQMLYTWFIDMAGLKERNVECLTIFNLCKKLLLKNFCMLPHDIAFWPAAAASNLKKIKERYYGIFIDEVQIFEQDWYKLCYKLLEDEDPEKHMFVICGDKTQKVKNQMKHGRAPWNVGEGYPNYSGKSLRIEKNYRNCIQINEYINRYVEHAKLLMSKFNAFTELDPDLFLRGKAHMDGIGVFMEKLSVQSNDTEAKTVIQTVKKIHDYHKIPYDEIAVVIFNRTYTAKISGWTDRHYNLISPLEASFRKDDIPYTIMYHDDPTLHKEDDGVAVISTESVLGLDFRGVVLCGLKPMGVHDKTKGLVTDTLIREADDEQYVRVNENISQLYVACTRAKEVLYIISPESSNESIYMNLLEKSL